MMSMEHCFNYKCNDHRGEKVDDGYYPRQVGEKGTLSKHDSREHRKRRAVRTGLGREGREKSVRDMNALDRTISDLRSQLDHAAQINEAKDNDLERHDKEKEKLEQAYNGVEQMMLKSEPRSGEKEVSIVGPMPVRERS